MLLNNLGKEMEYNIVVNGVKCIKTLYTMTINVDINLIEVKMRLYITIIMLWKKTSFSFHIKVDESTAVKEIKYHK